MTAAHLFILPSPTLTLSGWGVRPRRAKPDGAMRIPCVGRPTARRHFWDSLPCWNALRFTGYGPVLFNSEIAMDLLSCLAMHIRPGISQTAGL